MDELMNDTIDAAAPAHVRAFRVVAVTEAVTWLGLLAGMFVKHVLGGGDGAVAITGRIHGVVVLAYVAMTLWCGRRQRWGSRTLLYGLLASVPPDGSIFFERWATRTGRLADR